MVEALKDPALMYEAMIEVGADFIILVEPTEYQLSLAHDEFSQAYARMILASLSRPMCQASIPAAA